VIRPSLLITALALLAACSSSGPSFRNADITGADYGRDVALTGHDGKPRTIADFRGKAVVVFFGFTHCPDVCPTTMLEIKQAVQQLGGDAHRVQVLFVTLDPERDTPEMLSKYVPAFDPGFIGLYGDAQATARVAKDFKVFYQKAPGKSPGSYSIDHTAGIYVFDTQGRLRLFARPGKPADLAADLKTLLQGAA
jgi:protein SCO1/2